jgi:hypothetical protein
LGLAFVLVFLFLCIFACRATSSVTLSWQESTDPATVGYNVYYGGASGNYTNVVPAGDMTNVIISGLIAGNTYYFAATAYDDYDDESAFSNEISYIVPGILFLTTGSNSGNTVHIRFPLASRQQCQLQASQDLQLWTTIWQTTATSNGWMEFDDPKAGLLHRFYRLLFTNP